MLVLPGPGLLGLAAGLSILGTEFAWARRLLRGVRERARTALFAAPLGSAPVPDRADGRGPPPNDPACSIGSPPFAASPPFRRGGNGATRPDSVGPGLEST